LQKGPGDKPPHDYKHTQDKGKAVSSPQHQQQQLNERVERKHGYREREKERWHRSSERDERGERTGHSIPVALRKEKMWWERKGRRDANQSKIS